MGSILPFCGLLESRRSRHLRRGETGGGVAAANGEEEKKGMRMNGLGIGKSEEFCQP